jgi:hypothetical protein
MVSDGISKADWEEVVDLSAKRANAVCSGDGALGELFNTRLLRYLETLQQKYGRLPGILATMADCLDDPRKRIDLLEDAWRIASVREDHANSVLIASSLAELYIDELKDRPCGEQWLARLEESLENHWDDIEYEELQRLRTLAAAM